MPEEKEAIVTELMRQWVEAERRKFESFVALLTKLNDALDRLSSKTF